MCYEKSVKPFVFVKEFLKICFWVLLTTMIRIALSFIFKNELLDSIVTYCSMYVYLLIIALFSVRAQEKILSDQ